MPYSSHEGKGWVCDLLSVLQPAAVVDVGAGGGAWLDCVKPHLDGSRWTAVEVFPMNVARFDLIDRYDEVVVADVREWEFPPCDAVILGDVLEHMSRSEAVDVWNRAREAASLGVVASLPLGPYPQGPDRYGNAHEAHVETWTHEQVLALLPGVSEWFVGEVVGVYVTF